MKSMHRWLFRTTASTTFDLKKSSASKKGEFAPIFTLGIPQGKIAP
jgi:hypothetical protein